MFSIRRCVADTVVFDTKVCRRHSSEAQSGGDARLSHEVGGGVA